MSRAERFPEVAPGRPGADASAWIGRTAEREGMLTPELAGMLDAAVSHPLSAPRDLGPGAPLPPLWHWAAFPEFVPLADLGADGHPALGGFLPALGFQRRMWAGGCVRFEGRLRIGELLHRRSSIRAIAEKEGASGPMAFVTVDHVIEGETGARIEETQDIVYLDIPDAFRPPTRVEVPDDMDLDETVPITEARLFRYSAATYNAHRIHYDLAYAREVEKYPGLVVHGPLQATLAIEAAERHTGHAPASFRYRGVHPMFHGRDLRIVGQMVGRLGRAGAAIEVGTASPEGHYGLRARMEWS